LATYSLRAFRRVQLEEAFSGPVGERRLETLDRHLSPVRLTISVCRALANATLVVACVFLLGVRGEIGVERDWLAIVGAMGAALGVIAVFGVAIPHAWAAYAGERILAATFGILMALRWLLWPVVAVLQLFDVPIRRLSGVEEPNENGETAKQEILQVATEGRAEGAVNAEEVEMIESVMELAEKHAGEIMTPRTDIFALPVETTFDDACSLITEAGYTRVPVCRDDLDSIVGVVYAKDLLQHVTASQPPRLATIMRKPFLVPESKALDDLLTEFKARKLHLAIVLDEYGGTAGMVTVEDVIEEIVGDIADEYDKPEPEPMTVIDETAAELDGRVYIDDLNDALKLQVPEDEDYDTVAGLVVSELGHIPAAGETVEAYGARFTVLAGDERKITRLRVEVLAEGERQEEG